MKRVFVFGLAMVGLFLAPNSVLAVETSFLYTAGGQRVAKVSQTGEHTYYLPNVEVTVKPDGSTTHRRYYSFNGQLTAVKEDTRLTYTHTDNLGSLALATDTNGEVQGELAYYPYGTTRGVSGTTAGKLYTGQVSDEDLTGLYYYNARYYHPTLSRFTQADTVNDGLNRYAYVANNPINATDPTGHTPGPQFGTGPGVEVGRGDFLKKKINVMLFDMAAEMDEPLNIPEENMPAVEDLVNLSEIDLQNIDLFHPDEDYYIQGEAIESLEDWFGWMRENGLYPVLYSAYRSFDDQRELWEANPEAAAQPGHSQHHTGWAVDVYVWAQNDAGEWILGNVPLWAIETAQNEFGIVQPLGSYDPPHFVVLDSAGREYLAENPDFFRGGGPGSLNNLLNGYFNLLFGDPNVYLND